MACDAISTWPNCRKQVLRKDYAKITPFDPPDNSGVFFAIAWNPPHPGAGKRREFTAGTPQSAPRYIANDGFETASVLQLQFDKQEPALPLWLQSVLLVAMFLERHGGWRFRKARLASHIRVCRTAQWRNRIKSPQTPDSVIPQPAKLAC